MWCCAPTSFLCNIQYRGEELFWTRYSVSEGFYFGLHHLIMASLIHFEEKVHRKKLKRADTIPLLFLRLSCQILEYLGFLTEPQLERGRLCREWFTLEKWNQLAGYFAPPRVPPMVAPPMPPQLEQGELPAETTPPVPTHIDFGVSCPYAYLLDTHHHPFCSLLVDGWDACSLGLADCYSPPDSATPGTLASASARPSRILNAYSFSWGHYVWGGIISIRGSHYLIIGHLFILLYFHIILVEICPCFDAL